MSNTKQRQRYSTDFKKEAVALITEQHYSLSEAAAAVGTSQKNLQRWKQALAQEPKA